MTARAYYNECDPFAAAWLRELLAAGHIAAGDVDERPIQEVTANDVRGYTQCHWFAGIGGWSYALRLAGWPDDRAIWTGSCPCQPFSTVGKGAGVADARHLWPAWFRLIRECRPERVFGEQVEAAIRHGWLDLVSADMEAEGYALGACVLGAHSVGAPHRRQRCYFVADSSGSGTRWDAGRSDSTQATLCRSWDSHGNDSNTSQSCSTIYKSGVALGDTGDARLQGHGRSEFEPVSEVGAGAERHIATPSVVQSSLEQVGLSRRAREPRSTFWSACDWLPCRDGKSRPVEPGTFPLAHGVPARVGRLRGYGNAIVPQVAAAFIEAYLDVIAP